MSYYIAFSYEISNNTSEDTHTLIWKDINDVYNTLTYTSTKQMWIKVLNKLEKKGE